MSQNTLVQRQIMLRGLLEAELGHDGMKRVFLAEELWKGTMEGTTFSLGLGG